MAGIAGTSVVAAPLVTGLKLSSTLMYLAATGMLLIMNKIQPSQLVKEQRNAARLFKQLLGQIKTTMSLQTPTIEVVKKVMDKVLALDKAYPLPLIGVMLEKFPLEEEMREIVRVMKRKDKADYLRLGEKALKVNKVLALAGPLLTSLAAVGSAFVAPPAHGSWGVVLGVVGGALASVVNTLEHGGQVGMVFEMYRGNAGFFKLMEESIESNLKEGEVERRENGELFEMKVALQLGRSLSELKDLAADSSSRRGGIEEFASNLF
ncbi:hypothetical protein F0562_027521 [Nyssa sinensis]|uniref:Uncharacterized protein n=1 Tax=Nyssa sinensis TaxID=561372 RepID=A0A5J5B5D0_9ASTE|nr:hypothetical protein F0562_027521 [Nyssa sinensis]